MITRPAADTNAREYIRTAIKSARIAKGLTQDQLGEILDVDPVSVRRWEAGSRLPNVLTLESIGEALGLPSLANAWAAAATQAADPARA